MKLESVVVWRKQALQTGVFVSQNYLHLFSCAGKLFFELLKCNAFIWELIYNLCACSSCKLGDYKLSLVISHST